MKKDNEKDINDVDNGVKQDEKCGSKKVNSIIIIILAILVIVGVYILFSNKKDVVVNNPTKKEIVTQKKVENIPLSVDQKWSKAIEKGDLQSLSNFVKENPQSKYALAAAGFIDFMTKSSKPLSGEKLKAKKYSIRLKGTIYDRLGYVLDLNNDNGILSGSYYYTRYGTLNRGEIYGIKSGDNIRLYEKNKKGIKTGVFNCKLVGKTLTGDFFYENSRYAKKHMSVNLSVIKGVF